MLCAVVQRLELQESMGATDLTNDDSRELSYYQLGQVSPAPGRPADERCLLALHTWQPAHIQHDRAGAHGALPGARCLHDAQLMRSGEQPQGWSLAG